ncbi:hypothetical protein PanWU01x14_285320 [Parasponia andersonii]|uniref:Uncharacterized protein n=1 Tax=Parasponia andersonii TaxID=3476 RepID=A0A2P5AZL1_PARAD|nr:hypothetical protein PanWU01x14_285320 [Parasponia andersonii]
MNPVLEILSSGLFGTSETQLFIWSRRVQQRRFLLLPLCFWLNFKSQLRRFLKLVRPSRGKLPHIGFVLVLYVLNLILMLLFVHLRGLLVLVGLSVTIWDVLLLVGRSSYLDFFSPENWRTTGSSRRASNMCCSSFFLVQVIESDALNAINSIIKSRSTVDPIVDNICHFIIPLAGNSSRRYVPRQGNMVANFLASSAL